MRKRSYHLLPFMFLVSLLVLGQTACSRNDMRQMEKEKLNLKTRLNQTKQNISDRIAELQNNLGEADTKTRAEIEKKIITLQDQSNEIDARLKDIENATSKNWNDLKQKAETVISNSEHVL